MQKVIAFLEANVEWFALGIAMLFLGWTVYSYLIVNPVAKKIDGVEVTPSNVDKYIDEHSAEKLREAIDANNTTSRKFDVPDFTQFFQQKINVEGIQPSELASAQFDFAPFDVSAMPEGIENLGPPVDHLPTLPAAQPLLVAAALDTLTPPANANGGNPQPVAPVTPAGAAGGTPPAPGKNVRLVVAAFTIPWDEVYNQWNSAFGPPAPGGKAKLAPADFQVIQIAAYRSELVNDKWTPDEPVQVLNGADLPDYPQPGNKAAQGTYLLAVQKSPKALTAPDFPQVSAGVVWKDPVTYLPGNNNGTNGQPPFQSGAMIQPQADPLGNSTGAGTFRKIDAQYRGGGGPGGPGGGGPGGYGARFGPPIPFQRPTPQLQQPAPQEQLPPPPVAPAPGTVDAVVKLVNPNPPAMVPVNLIAKLNPPAMPVKSPDLCIYIIDTTAEAGKTYRYSISYKTLNPVYNKPPQRVSAKGQAWVNQFDLEAKVSAYSPQITVPTQTYFFCGTGTAANKGTYPFEVFTWTGGKWLKDIFNAAVGDPIGGEDGGIDYSTGWTYADLRSLKQNTQRVVTLVDRDGNIIVRDASTDANSDDYKKATQWVEQTKNGGQQPMQGPQFGPQFGPGGPSPYGGMPYGPGGPTPVYPQPPNGGN